MIRTDLFEKTDSQQALDLLRDGNQRHVHGLFTEVESDTTSVRQLLAQNGQRPFAVIVCCSDSRVSPELIFDVGLGQLFVVRTAGNVVDAIAIGSVEYAVEHLGVQLVLVVGHSGCGAVAAAVSGGDFGPNIGAIVAEITPSLAGVAESDDVAAQCEDENIRHTVAKLRTSEILADVAAHRHLRIVGSKYDLASGVVDFFE
jgi:carbonic anhydrase